MTEYQQGRVPGAAGQRAPFRPFHTVLVPIVHGDPRTDALDAAIMIARRIVLVGLVRVESDENMSIGAAAARDLRAQMQEMAQQPGITAHAQVYANTAPWLDLAHVAAELKPDLMLIDWDTHLSILGLTTSDVLDNPPCNVALLRGHLPPEVGQILLPLRGGPHAELVTRLGLSFRLAKPVVLHLQTNAATHHAGAADAPFRGLQQVLPQLRGVETRIVVDDDIAQGIIDASRGFDLLIMGATGHPLGEPTSLGRVPDQVLQSTTLPLIVVKSVSPLRIDEQIDAEEGAPRTTAELAGGGAISLLVDKWFAENTFHSQEFADIERLVEQKQQQGLTISLALPALNEEQTVGNVIGTVQRTLMQEFPLIDEIVLIDSNSTDNTRDIAASLGVPVYIHQEMLPRLGARRGKGEALWKSLLVTSGDIVAWIDTDIVNIDPRFVYGIVGPLIANPGIQYVKGFYKRPLTFGTVLQEGGGRVTELMARPLLNLFYPELSGVVQPLSGEYAGRRGALESATFYSGYGVETGMLIDIFERYGLSAIAQVDLLERVHHNQPLGALSKMSFAIAQVVMQRLEKRTGAQMLLDVNRTMKLINNSEEGYYLTVEEIAERERPPMNTVREYRERFNLT